VIANAEDAISEMREHSAFGNFIESECQQAANAVAKPLQRALEKYAMASSLKFSLRFWAEADVMIERGAQLFVKSSHGFEAFS
jgi:hypothetical protein